MMDFFKRRKDLSDSSASLSPTGLTLESPSTFQVSAVKPALSEATMKQKDKQDAVLAMPSMFQEEKEADEKILTDLTRGAPADPANVYLAPKTIDEDETNKNKNHYLEETFAIRAPHNTPKTRVGQESIVVVDIRINARIRDDESLASELSFRMSQIYQRPETYMMVAVQQDANLRFGNVALPAYFMKLMALPSLVGPVTNLRNTILIQAVLQELLGIKPNRGVIIYVPVPEDSFATNGATAMGEIARLEREGGDPGILKTISRGVSRRLKSNSTHSNPMSIATTASWVNSEGQAAGPRSVGDLVSPINSKEKPRTVKKTKSIREFVARRLTDLGGFGPMAP